MKNESKLPRELKKGIIELGILSILHRGEKYGWQIIRELDNLSNGFLKIKEGTLYPALHRMENRGLIESRWVVEGNPPRKYYKLTKSGIESYKDGKELWKRLVECMDNILGENNE